jgi:four helix bundle protein
MPNALAPATVDDDCVALDLDRLDAYRVALEFQRLAATFVTHVHGELRSQLDRASLSIALNLAEGVGRRSRADRRHFYSIARGSALECVAILDVLASRGLLTLGDLHRSRMLLVRIVQMVTRLAQR